MNNRAAPGNSKAGRVEGPPDEHEWQRSRNVPPTNKGQKLPPEPLNVAVTARACVIDTVQLLVPVHAPLQPANVEPMAAVARVGVLVGRRALVAHRQPLLNDRPLVATTLAWMELVATAALVNAQVTFSLDVSGMASRPTQWPPASRTQPANAPFP